MSRSDVDDLFDKIQRAAPTKSKIEEGNLIVDTTFHALVEPLLTSEDNKAALASINKDGFFIVLSKDFVVNGIQNHFSKLNRLDTSHCLSSLANVIKTIAQYLGRPYNLKERKTAVVESLCLFLNVSADNTASTNRSTTTPTETFSDLAKKTVGYIFWSSNIISNTMCAINISAGLARYMNDDDRSISAGALQSMFSTLLATGLLNHEDCYGGFDEFLICMHKGLCICLSHYAAANPFLIENFFTPRDDGDAGAHFLQSSKGIPMGVTNYYTSFHQATFFVSMFWTALTYIVFFGMSRPFRAFLMALHMHSVGVVHLAHQVPMSGGSECALSSSTLTRPSLFKRAPTLKIEGTVASDHNNQLTRFVNKNDFSGIIRFKVQHQNTISIRADVARDNALNYLDIMSSYLKTMAHPMLYDAYDLGKLVSEASNVEAPRYVMNALNAMSVAPCWIVPTRGFTVESMDAHVKDILGTPSVYKNLYGEDRWSNEKAKNAMAVADLLRPTIKAFLYAHRTRSFVPSDVICLGLHGYDKKHKIDGPTAKFLNQMDRYFFKYLKTELSLIEDASARFGGDQFFNYGVTK
jgi:hypothetical protein